MAMLCHVERGEKLNVKVKPFHGPIYISSLLLRPSSKYSIYLERQYHGTVTIHCHSHGPGEHRQDFDIAWYCTLSGNVRV